ncbi:MAG: FAD:protein FMN transferase [Candidatus Uhrbacteria bacterium]|nr:FAD:protein FMN transferase [Candidatus Uhrbacteria bacterium]
MTWEFEAIGTHWKIDLLTEISDSQASDIFKLIQKRIAVYDKHYSRFRDDSLIASMSKQSGEYVLPDDAKPLFDLYEKMYRLTNGSVTPLIGNVLSDAGYDATYSLEPKSLSSPMHWELAMEYAFPKLLIKQPVLIDVGAAGKGYLIDIVGDLLQRNGVSAFTINAGGDILHADVPEKKIRVGLEHPNDSTSVIGVAQIGNESICGSAGNRRAWKQFHHIMDPFTLTSPKHLAAVWVIAKNARTADALTTCLFFVEPEVLQKEFDFAYLIVSAEYTFKMSQDFPAELFIT